MSGPYPQRYFPYPIYVGDTLTQLVLGGQGSGASGTFTGPLITVLGEYHAGVHGQNVLAVGTGGSLIVGNDNVVLGPFQHGVTGAGNTTVGPAVAEINGNDNLVIGNQAGLTGVTLPSNANTIIGNFAALPDGTDNTVLITNGLGTIVFQSDGVAVSIPGFAAGGVPGGPGNSVQYNNAGAFGGVAGYVFDGVSKIGLGIVGGSLGAVAFANLTSGSLTIQPVAGALGANVLSLPAVTDTVAVKGANAFTAAQSVSLAVAAASVDGLTLATTTAATVGAQKFSPAEHFTGSGFATTSGTARTVDVRVELRPVQGAANPSAILAYSFSVNSGAYADFLTVTSTGTMVTGAGITSGNSSVSGGVGMTFLDIYVNNQNTLAARISSTAGVLLGAALDIGVARKAAKVQEFNSGALGAYLGVAWGAGAQTVAQLPAAATAGPGARATVTDALAPAFGVAVAAGGAVTVPVYCDGAAWLVG